MESAISLSTKDDEKYLDLRFLEWSNINSMNQVRMFHTASLLRDGKLLVVGGSSDAGYVIF